MLKNNTFTLSSWSMQYRSVNIVDLLNQWTRESVARVCSVAHTVLAVSCGQRSVRSLYDECSAAVLVELLLPSCKDIHITFMVERFLGTSQIQWSKQGKKQSSNVISPPETDEDTVCRPTGVNKTYCANKWPLPGYILKTAIPQSLDVLSLPTVSYPCRVLIKILSMA